ncbi:hypothetical protein AALO_G00289620 [Alosa alosa]|uniref:Uncharacterized protein n=1 Tax=Alosa alosa TaxID=278164 RepID=A0AAV6FHB0_9TELE|nr:hypothetical protein AALO_G00289620 [Alosa alosa]
MAGALPSAHLLFVVCQFYVVTHVHAGAYYGHKQLPQQQLPQQHLPQQHQPMPQIPHMPHGKETYPQQQYLGKDMHHIPYGNEMPILPQYREDPHPQMPIPMGKGKGKGKGETVPRGEKGNGGDVGPEKLVDKDFRASPGVVANQVTRVYQEFLEFPVQKETKGLVFQDCLDLKGQQVLLDHQGQQMGCLENQDFLVVRGNLVHMASLEDQGYLVLENQDIQVLKVTKDMVVYLVNQVQKVIRVMVALQG